MLIPQSNSQQVRQSQVIINLLMSINLSQSPIKARYLHQLSTQIKYLYEVVSDFNCGTSTNIVDKTFESESNHINQYIRVFRAQFILREIFQKRLMTGLLRVKKRSLQTEMSERDVVGKEEYERIMMEEGFIQLDYVFKSDTQKNKVMGFEFIKYTYKEYKRKKERRMRAGLDIMGTLLRNRFQRSKQTAFNQIVQYAASRPSLSQYKFAFKFLDKLMIGCCNRRKKQGFQNLIRYSVSEMKQKTLESTTRREPSSQHIFVVKPKLNPRKKSETIFVKVPIVSERVYLQELNFGSRRKERRSTSGIKEVRYKTCNYCEYSKTCKYCEMLRVLDI